MPVSVTALLAAACVTLPAPQGSTQLVTVQAPRGDTTAALSLWEKRGRCWQRVAGPWTARLGRSGLSSMKREGDGATPTGTFRLGATVCAASPIRHSPPVPSSCAATGGRRTPVSAAYNRFRHVACGARPGFGGDSEALWRITPQYRYFAVIK